MATKTSAREIVIVCEEHIFQGSIRTKGKVDRSKISSLIDLLSNPVKTQPDDPTAQTGKDLLYISDALVYSIKSDSYEQMKGLYLPSENIIFAFEIKPDQFEGNPAFKLQAQMEYTTRQRLKIGIGEYTFEGWNINFFSRYNKPNIDFIAMIDAELGFAKPIRVDLKNRPFYALNKRKINYIGM